jgi:hypothetical protein
MPQPLVELEEQDGDLIIKLLPEGREEITSALDQKANIDSDDFFHRLLEHPLSNGWEMIRPEEIGALTSAPILANDLERNEDGELVRCGRVYWFPNYQIESPVQTLFEAGTVRFSGAE